MYAHSIAIIALTSLAMRKMLDIYMTDMLMNSQLSSMPTR